MNEPTSLFESEAKEFISKVSSTMRWNDVAKDVIMDIGCGFAKSCCEQIVKSFPSVGKLIGVDSNPGVIDKIRTENKHPNVEYHCANIEDRSTLERWEGKISKIVSTRCIHQVKDKESAFKNIYSLLVPGGEASILFCLQSGIYEWYRELLTRPRWESIYKGSKDALTFYYPKSGSVSYYSDVLKSVGFTVIQCYLEERSVPFATDEICRDNMIVALSVFDVPAESKEELYGEAFEMYLKYNSRNEEGKPCYRSNIITIIVTKP